MNKNLLLQAILDSNLQSTTKSFLFSILKSNNNEESTQETPEQEKTEAQTSINETPQATVEEDDEGVSIADRILAHASELGGKDLWQLNMKELSTVQPWEEKAGEIAFSRYEQGVPLTPEERAMVKRLSDMERLRKQRYDQMVQADFNDPVQIQRWRRWD